MKIFKTALALIASAVFITGCLVPEKFTATINIQADSSYEYRYAGTAVNAMIAAQIKQMGSLPAKVEESAKADATQMKKDSTVKSANYLGNARYDLIIEGKKKPSEALKLLDILTVHSDKNGVTTISSPELKDKDLKGLAELGIKIDGTLEISLPKNAEIISQNATSTPTFFGLFGKYSWKIGRTDQRPVMKFKLKA